MLKDNGVPLEVLTLYCDDLSINILKNPIQHSRTKQIDICYHYIRSLVEDKVIDLRHIPTENQLADILTKIWMLISMSLLDHPWGFASCDCFLIKKNNKKQIKKEN